MMGIPEEKEKGAKFIKAILAKTSKPGEQNGHPDPCGPKNHQIG